MQMAIDVAGFTAAEADQLRRAMGSKRSTERMERLRERLYDGMAAQRHHRRRAPTRSSRSCWRSPTSASPRATRSASRTSSTPARGSSCYHPAAFCAALLNAQPMGFYSPQSLVADARRHGVVVRRPRRQRSDGPTRPVPRRPQHGRPGAPAGAGRGAHDRAATSPRRSSPRASAAARSRDLADLARGSRLTTAQVEALATAGAFGCFGVDRREALWAAGAVARCARSTLPGTAVGAGGARRCRGMTAGGAAPSPTCGPPASPPTATPSSTCGPSSTGSARPLDRRRPEPPSDPEAQPPRVLVGGLVTHRQRPATAGGVTFVNLEDETRHAQRHLLGGAVGALPHGGAGQRGACSCGDGSSAVPRGCSTWWPTGCRSWPWPSPSSRGTSGECEDGPVTATVMDGKAALAEILVDLTGRVEKLAAAGVTPGLGTLLVGDDPGSHAYVRGKHRDCAKVGIASIQRELPADATRPTSSARSTSSTPTRRAPASSSSCRCPAGSTRARRWSGSTRPRTPTGCTR